MTLETALESVLPSGSVLFKDSGSFNFYKSDTDFVPVRVQRKRTKGYKMPENTVSVTRPGKWGNPFKVGEPIWNPYHKEPSLIVPSSIEQCIDLYKEYMKGVDVPGTWMHEDIHELKGKNLACFCDLDAPCHADHLLELANQSITNPL